MKKNILIILILLFSLSGLYASDYVVDKKYDKKPKKDEVLIVTKISFSPTPDNAFYTKYTKILAGYKTKEEVIKPRIYIPMRTSWGSTSYASLGDESELTSVKFDIPKDRVIRIEFLRSYLANIEYLNIFLPLNIEFTVPEGVNYVYLGSFIYDYEGYQFNIKNIRKVDDYDNAVKFVAEKYGSDVKLERVPIRELTPKEDKKKK